jgi:DNA-binding NarL/FixJ family response regulator
MSMDNVFDTRPIRVALVEDDSEFQNALAAAIEPVPDMQLVGIAQTRVQGLSMLNMERMDVLLVDLGLPDGSGIDVIQAAHARWPGCNIMVSTTFGDEAHVIRSLEAGATGYLLKDSSPEQIVSEIRSLHSGGSPISPLIARQLLVRFHSARKSAENTPAIQPTVELSMREKQVLEYITMGFTADEISNLLSVSRHTVVTYIRRTYSKLEVNTKAEAIYEARKQGLLNEN